ncbi:MAG TPA: hypothetical protein VN922_08325, partial [Bacteroidia bacterium]|nr:hypothetical protein [Bacteroidia bacterium]
MKKHLLLCFVILFKMSFAQDASVAFDSKEMKNFLSGTLYVISTGNASFDSSLASSVKQYWKMTSYQMVAKADAETYLKDESKYLLVFVHQKNL